MFNKQNVKEFRSDFQLAVAKLEKDYGVAISLGTIRFDANELRSKMTAKVGNAPVKAKKDDFEVGDIVGITHKKVNPNDEFKIVKINSKNIKVQAINVGDGRVGGLFTVTPSLLVKK